VTAITTCQSDYLDCVAQIGCIACICLGFGRTAAEIHHIREGRLARNHWMVLPLCPQHHRGSRMSVHQDKRALLTQIGVQSEFDLQAMVIGYLNGEKLPYGGVDITDIEYVEVD
jgi:hypothetical protein